MWQLVYEMVSQVFFSPDLLEWLHLLYKMKKQVANWPNLSVSAMQSSWRQLKGPVRRGGRPAVLIESYSVLRLPNVWRSHGNSLSRRTSPRNSCSLIHRPPSRHSSASNHFMISQPNAAAAADRVIRFDLLSWDASEARLRSTYFLSCCC